MKEYKYVDCSGRPNDIMRVLTENAEAGGWEFEQFIPDWQMYDSYIIMSREKK